ncbi:uncharacterized protein LOC124174149 [Ischnura elegans]|uniref:uncharacterized protein LOC124174149 n=1 Tax=Ischnura elegans TaxID=197161 RepID=UPI001ED893B6|nr:uncharacterized protein LOC124174149 [Ischnura elegans]
MSKMCTLLPLLLPALLLCSAAASDIRSPPHFLTSPEGGGQSDRRESLYKAPAPYRALGRPLLNSFIVTSRPLDLRNLLSKRKKNGDKDEGVATTPSPSGEYHYIPQFKIECVAGRGPCSETITSPSVPTTPPTFKQHSQESITRFVQTLRDGIGNGIRRNGDHGSEEETGPEGEMSSGEGTGSGQHSSKLSKANLWYRPSPHRPPHNDKKGWVALDPVPWSSSKISKWAPDKNNPGSKPPEATRAPFPQRTPHPTEAPSYHRPPTNAFYQGGQHWHNQPKPPRPHDSFQTASSASSPIIITDGKDPEWPSTHSGPQRPVYNSPTNDRPTVYSQIRPETSNFPNYYPDHRPSMSHRPHGWGASGQQQDGSSRRPQHYPTPVVYHDEPSSSSEDHYANSGGGQWVVLSDTKEYKPKTADRRSYGRVTQNEDTALKNKRVRTSRRMVKLMVLPSEGNITTSHGGMLEVDGSFDTVDEDRRKRMLAQVGGGAEQGNENNAKPIVVRALVPKYGGQVSRADHSKAVIAAVGAGMVPATVAAILPMVLARRSRRSVGLRSATMQDRLVKDFENFPKNIKPF